MKKWVYLFLVIWMVSCKDDADLVLNECKAENVTQDLSWLKNIIESTKQQPVGLAQIHSYTYQGLTVYAANLCVQCPDSVTKVYNCQGEVICEFSNATGSSSCRDFERLSSDKRLIWRSPK